MPDFVKKIKKARPDDLQAGEELVAATIGQPSGTFSRQVLGGVAGVMIAKKMGEKRTATLEGADASGMAASVPADQQLVVGLTDRRMQFFEQGVMSGNPKEMVAAFPLTDVHEITLEKHKMTASLTIRFADNSARMLECVKMAKPQDLVDAFAKAKGSRAA
jgi:hypothetical protein